MLGFLKRRERQRSQDYYMKKKKDPPQIYSFHVNYYDRLVIKDPSDGPPEVHLMNGREFALKTPKDIKKIVFTDEPVKLDRMGFDASMEQDGSVTAWCEQNVMYVTSGRKGIPIKAPSDSKSMFLARDQLETVDFRNLDLSTAVEFTSMFDSCSKLRYLDMSKCDVSNAICMNDMFANCTKLRYLCIDGWNTAKCRNFDRMFSRCECLRTVDISHFDCSSALSTARMFAGCTRLIAVIMGNFTVPVANEDQHARYWTLMKLGCNNMFYATPNLKTLVSTDPRIIEEFKKEDIASSKERNVIPPSKWTPKCADDLEIHVEKTPPPEYLR